MSRQGTLWRDRYDWIAFPEQPEPADTVTPVPAPPPQVCMSPDCNPAEHCIGATPARPPRPAHAPGRGQACTTDGAAPVPRARP